LPFAALIVAAPWAWFLVRDAWAPLNAVAVTLPAISIGAAAVLMVLAVLTRRWLPVLVAISTLLMAAGAIFGPRLAHEASGPSIAMSIVFANVYEANTSPEQAAQDLLSRGADIVAAAELRDHTRAALDEQSAGYPYVADHRQLTLRSRWPLEILPIPEDLPDPWAMLTWVRPPDGDPFRILVLHVPNPSSATTFETQAEQVELIVSIVQRLERRGPIVVVGDLNLSDRTTGYRLLDSHLFDAMRAGDLAHNTYAGGAWRFAMLRIDHLFLAEGWCASNPRVFVVHGSDHRGIGAAIGPCP